MELAQGQLRISRVEQEKAELGDNVGDRLISASGLPDHAKSEVRRGRGR